MTVTQTERSEVGYSNLLIMSEAISAVVLSGRWAVSSGRSVWRRSFVAWSFFGVALTKTLIGRRTSSTTSRRWSLFIFVTWWLTGGWEQAKFWTESNCSPVWHAEFHANAVMYPFTWSRHVLYVAVDSRGFMKPHQPFAYDISPKVPLLAAGVSSVLSDGGVVCDISQTLNLRQQAQWLTFHQKTLTYCPNIMRCQLIVKLSIIIIIRRDSSHPWCLPRNSLHSWCLPWNSCHPGICFSALHISGIDASCQDILTSVGAK